MPVIRVRLTLSGDDLDRALTRLSRKLADLSVPLGVFGHSMMGSVLQNFARQGRPKRWKPLAASTIMRKGSDIALIDTGRMITSIGVACKTDRVVLRADVPYAAVQQHGGRAGRSGSAVIPARPFLVFQDEDVAGLKVMLADYLAEP